MAEEEMADAGRVTTGFGDWLSTGNSNSIAGELYYIVSN